MFSYEQRIKAVQLYLKYGKLTSVIAELGYPTINALRVWVKEYKEYSDLHITQTRTAQYSESQIQYAVDYHLNHGKNMAKALRDLGYPNRQYLKQWLLDKVPNFKSSCRIGKSLVQLSKDKKHQVRWT